MSTKAVFIYNKANVYGLKADVQFLENVLKGFSIKHADPLEPPTPYGLAVHFEVPYYGWMPWAERNVFMVNPEWWSAEWNPYLARADALLFKCEADLKSFFTQHSEVKTPAFAVTWTSPITRADFAKSPQNNDVSVGFLWLLGASANKRKAAPFVLGLWQESWPPLTVYTTTPLPAGETPLASNVTVKVQDLDEESRRRLQAYYPGHLIFSAAEALCMAAQEGRSAGAFLLGNELPTYKEQFGTNSAVHLTPATLAPLNAGFQDTFAALTAETLGVGVRAFLATDPATIRQKQWRSAIETSIAAYTSIQTTFNDIMTVPKVVSSLGAKSPPKEIHVEPGRSR